MHPFTFTRKIGYDCEGECIDRSDGGRNEKGMKTLAASSSRRLTHHSVAQGRHCVQQLPMRAQVRIGI